MLPAMDGQTSDQDLMLQYGSGNADAFAELYARHKGPLYRFFKRQCRHELVDELFQETWARVIKARASYKASAKFTTWLYRIAHNLLIDYGRKHSRQPHLVAVNSDEDSIHVEDTQASVSERAQASQLGQRLLDAINSLPIEQREAFLLKEESGLSLNEIAEVLDVGKETVKSRLRYAVKKLRTSLSEEKESYL